VTVSETVEVTVYQKVLKWRCTKKCWIDSVPENVEVTVYQKMLKWRCTRRS